MILKNGKILSNGLIHNGSILINNGIIAEISFNPNGNAYKGLLGKNQDGKVLNCENRLILPGIIDIHSHLRDMEQNEKETFLSGTKAAAYSGITTVFNMPNTKPPGVTEKQVKKWIDKAQEGIYVNVGFISGVPKGFDETEIEKIINLGVVGFKIYPMSPLSEIDWYNSDNIQKILNISSKYQIPIFIHAAYPLSDLEKDQVLKTFKIQKYPILDLHDRLNPVENEEGYTSFIIQNYKKNVAENKLKSSNIPIIHFCHVSCIQAYICIQEALQSDNKLRITFEVTPHHLLLSSSVTLEKDNHAKVLPPLRKIKHSEFLLNEFKEGKILIIGTDHAPHTLDEKSQDYLTAPSGFPGFETHSTMLLNEVFHFRLSLENFVKASSENPAKVFNLKNKGFVKEHYDADLVIIDKIPEYSIKALNFKSKAKFSPFENSKSTVQIWKVFLMGVEINNDSNIPHGKIIKMR